MRGVLLLGHGGLEMLEYRQDLPVPVPGPNEVLIEVGACGINNTDVNTRVGWYNKGGWSGSIAFPRIQGADAVGTIVGVGDEVPSSRVGERVLVDPWLRGDEPEQARYLGSEVDGGFAEYVAVPGQNAHMIDSPLSDAHLATFACSFSTAEHMLFRADVTEDQSILVTGASGGVGGALIQLAKRRGARVVAITGQSKRHAVAALGADLVLTRDSADFEMELTELSGEIDVVADVVGGAMFESTLGTLRRGGHYTTSGAVAGSEVTLDLQSMYLRDLTMHGATVVPSKVFEDLVGYIERGEVSPVLADTYPLSQMKTAQETFLTRTHVGGIAIEVLL